MLQYSVRAERDLEAIADWTAIDNPARAVTFVQELRDKCRDLIDFPKACPRVPGTANLHKSLYHSYLICHQVTESGITITAIVHGARNQSVRH